MKAYRSLLTARFKNMLQYRGAALAGFICQLFFGLVMVMAYDAFYASTYHPLPISFSRIVTYIWLGQAFLGLLPWNLDSDFQDMVTTGAVAYELLRPLDLYTLWFTRSMAAKAANTLLRALPMFFFTIVLLPLLGAKNWALLLPSSWLQISAFLLSMLDVVLLSTALTTVFNLSLIWTISGRGIITFINPIVSFFSGMIIPLPLFPDALQKLLAFLPFRGLVDAPYRLFTGHIPPSGYFGVFFHQLVWIFFLIMLGRWLTAHACRKMVVQGG